MNMNLETEITLPSGRTVKVREATADDIAAALYAPAALPGRAVHWSMKNPLKALLKRLQSGPDPVGTTVGASLSDETRGAVQVVAPRCPVCGWSEATLTYRGASVVRLECRSPDAETCAAAVRGEVT